MYIRKPEGGGWIEKKAWGAMVINLSFLPMRKKSNFKYSIKLSFETFFAAVWRGRATGGW
jgi:hypothetical protein